MLRKPVTPRDADTSVKTSSIFDARRAPRVAGEDRENFNSSCRVKCRTLMMFRMSDSLR